MKLSSTAGARPIFRMRLFRLAFALPIAALLLPLAAKQLHAQDADDGLLRRGPQGPRPPQTSPYTPPQSALPATPATSQPTPAAATTPTDLNKPPTTRARVTYANGLLEVRADNSSLLQILHDISRITHMAITGGVAETRIFGDYGPASPTTVLSTLLDGTGANMLLQQDPVTGAPIELTLTQRAGGAPPSSPNGPGFDDSPFPDDVSSPIPDRSTPASNALTQPATAPADPNAPHPTNYVPGSPFNSPNPPPEATLTTVTDVPAAALTASPKPTSNGTATPESIYQQLLQMQQAKTKAKASQPTTPPTSTAPDTPAASTTTPK